jgi:formate dehydrogenase iron-sulfur subunit
MTNTSRIATASPTMPETTATPSPCGGCACGPAPSDASIASEAAGSSACGSDASGCDAASDGCGSGSAGSDQIVLTLIDQFLAEQASTTAVERFSRAHDELHGGRDDGPNDPGYAGMYDADEPFALAQRSGYWRDLMPATPPGPGQQYAFEVDLDSCSGCKACIVACSNLNGLDPGTSFRSVGALMGTETPMLQNVTTACHHCVDPGCLTGCPVDAYEKDPISGIVKHLDDQCIGCQYCTLTCPYEVPQYDQGRGIVRKCDLCQDRLAEGEAPACVNACPTEAIAVRIVDVDSAVEGAAEPWSFSSPDPDITTPTTVFRSTEDLRSGVVAAAADAVTPAHAHPPLTVMLVLTQIAVGTLVLLVCTEAFTGVLPDLVVIPAAVTALVSAVVALAASVLHLGRPQYAWRAVIGLRHSWLSREIGAFGAFAPAAAAYAAALMGFPVLADHTVGLGALAAAAGLAGVFTSAMVYAVTGRAWWSLPRTLGRFLLTTLAGGVTTLLAVVTVVGAVTGLAVSSSVAALALPSTVVALLIAASEAALLRRHDGPVDDEIARTARLLTRRLRGLVAFRVAAALTGGAILPWLAWRMLTVEPTSATAAAVTTLIGLAAVVLAELAERWRFFTAVAPVRMPGRLP